MGAGENMKSRKKAAAAAIAGNVIFGLSFMFSRVVLLTVDTFVMLALRFSIAFLAMNVLVVARVVKVDLKKDLRPLLALGLFAGCNKDESAVAAGGSLSSLWGFSSRCCILPLKAWGSS